ncbi:DUF3159 domain-containing protein [Humidisolicoccus flavus]|uniref:DUF3159 domain-containing protein n=1 Tax=Humidisolicoccus flavus TaxID=3111414 RepID=UPI003251986A
MSESSAVPGDAESNKLPARNPHQGQEPDSASTSDVISEKLKATSLGSLMAQDQASPRAILEAIGGVRGLFESLVPGMAFLILYTFTQDLWLSVLAPLALSVIFVTIRVIGKGHSMLAFAGLFGVGLSALLAILTNRPENNFVWGFVVNGAVLAVLLISLLARRPLIGLIVGSVVGKPKAWRIDANKKRIAWIATLMWLAVIAARLLVQVPLYFAEATEALAATRLIMGVPLYAAALWVTWLLVRSVMDPLPAGESQPGSKERKIS